MGTTWHCMILHFVIVLTPELLFNPPWCNTGKSWDLWEIRMRHIMGHIFDILFLRNLWHDSLQQMTSLMAKLIALGSKPRRGSCSQLWPRPVSEQTAQRPWFTKPHGCKAGVCGCEYFPLPLGNSIVVPSYLLNIFLCLQCLLGMQHSFRVSHPRPL